MGQLLVGTLKVIKKLATSQSELIPDRLTPDSHYSIELSLEVLYHKDVITPCLTDLGSVVEPSL